ncbi:uncharacterized protein LOC143202472 [Rhynchophorus ferrugineus]|uniref:uncharacterized protein LOC143202472 n=1 Tax=Rhynchophorus ferrugineus TaxID=354439 RepID=UPI003FCCE52C
MMKILFLFGCVLLGLTSAKIPSYIKPLICRASDPNIEKCLYNSFEKSRPYLIKGIPELSFPPLDPFKIPIMTVNRTLNELVSIEAICRDVVLEGGRNTIIDSIKADIDRAYGELRVTVPWFAMEMDYDVSGRLLSIPLLGKGHFKGNFTDIKLSVKGSLERYQKKGEDYFRVKKVNTKGIIGDGWVKLTSKNPNLQLGADIISNFFNENPRRTMDAINPIFVETYNELFRVIADQILVNLKASEWLPA